MGLDKFNSRDGRRTDWIWPCIHGQVFCELQGVPSVYYDVVHRRFQETARDIEKMAGRPMSPSRKLTCQLQVICTYARHYLLDKMPGGEYFRGGSEIMIFVVGDVFEFSHLCVEDIYSSRKKCLCGWLLRCGRQTLARPNASRWDQQSWCIDKAHLSCWQVLCLASNWGI